MTSQRKMEAQEYRSSFIDADFRPKNRPGVQCYRCGRVIKENSSFRVVHVVESQLAVHPEDEHLAPDNDDWLPLGMDCARRIGFEFTHPSTLFSLEAHRTFSKKVRT